MVRASALALLAEEAPAAMSSPRTFGQQCPTLVGHHAVAPGFRAR